MKALSHASYTTAVARKLSSTALLMSRCCSITRFRVFFFFCTRHVQRGRVTSRLIPRHPNRLGTCAGSPMPLPTVISRDRAARHPCPAYAAAATSCRSCHADHAPVCRAVRPCVAFFSRLDLFFSRSLPFLIQAIHETQCRRQIPAPDQSSRHQRSPALAFAPCALNTGTPRLDRSPTGILSLRAGGPTAELASNFIACIVRRNATHETSAFSFLHHGEASTGSDRGPPGRWDFRVRLKLFRI